MNEKIKNLYQERDTLMNKAEALLAEGKHTEADAVLKEVDQLDNKINVEEKFFNAKKPTQNAVTQTQTKTGFANFAEFLNVVKASSAQNAIIDKRLISNDALGVNQAVDADGGFLIPPEYMTEVLQSAFEQSEILKRVSRYTVAPNANRVTYPILAETDISTSVRGGIQAYWVDEAGTVTPTKPAFDEMNLKLRKLMGLVYVTEEMLEDAPFMAQFVRDGLADAFALEAATAVVGGTGDTGRQPFGILASDLLEVVTPADTTKISYKDFLNMKLHMLNKDWANAAWYMNPDLEAILPTLADDNGNPVYMPEGGISGAQYGTILGKPVIFDSNLAAAGSQGDILLANLKQYGLFTKGDIRQDVSLHVRFLYDEQCFRAVWRLNGAPMIKNKIRTKNSQYSKSPFVALGARVG